MKVLLVGYYGKGNFGDDVLLKVTHGVVRQWQPDAEISVLCDQYMEDYVPTLIGEKVKIVQPGSRECFDVIVHGGGGTYFDFDQGRFLDDVLNRLISLIGFKNYVSLDRFIREKGGKQRLSAKKRIGWGIGVGTYTSSSKKLKHHISTLLDFEDLVVRDSVSIMNLARFNLSGHILLGSDLAFIKDYWATSIESTHSLRPEVKPKIGFVLRDWPAGKDSNYLQVFFEMLPKLDDMYDLSLFIFDKRTDHELLNLSKSYKTHVWAPPVTNLVDFCSLLAQQNALVTSRAHGAICGAVLSVPSVLIEIEPKLKTIHDMLPLTTCLISPRLLNHKTLIEAINSVSKYEYSVISEDVEKNRMLVDDALKVSLNG